ncbi:MAG: PQQ-binding-like beta-propeller repeat protein [Vicingaceae bacterium]
MKTKMLTLAAALALSVVGFAQEEMKVQWEKQYDHKSDMHGTGLEGEVSYLATDKEITVFNNDDGSVVWTNRFKDLAPKLRKIDELIPFWDSNCIFLFDKRTGKDQIAVVDLKTGKLLWNSERYKNLGEDNIVYISEKDGFALSLKDALIFVKARTGEEVWETTKFKGVVGKYLYEDGHITTLNLNPGGLKGLFKGFKNQLAKINMDNGDIIWENTFIGVAEKKLLTGEPIYDLYKEGNKLFLKLNGLQVYDESTGATLWSATHDGQSLGGRSNPGGANFSIVKQYGTVAEPVIHGNDVYVVEMTKKRDQTISKYDLNTGKLLWQSPDIKKAKAIPGLFVSGDKVMVQIGGVVERHTYSKRTDSEGNVTITRRIDYPNIKPNGLQAFNVSDGSFAWRSEKFKKGITNAFLDGDNIIVCSGKALYSLVSETGADNYEKDVKDAGVGNAVQIIKHKDMIAVIGEKGIATYKIASGDFVNASKYKKSSMMKRNNEVVIMETDKSDIACFDLNTCKYEEYNNKKSASSTLSQNGDYVYVYQKKDVTKLKTR